MSKCPEIDAVLAGESEGCIICADCLEVMADMPDGCVDAVVTDPPYGIGEHGGKCRTRGRAGYSKHANAGWDKQRPSQEVFGLLLALDVPSVIWGGNYFADMLPPTMGWLYWQKLMGGDFSDGELAWTSQQRALKEFTACPKGINKTHPCEKPVTLMEWCIERLGLADNAVIFDPFCGSGTTCVAAKKLGRRYIGIEINEQYCEIARKRLRDTPKPLFTEHATADAPKTGLFE